MLHREVNITMRISTPGGKRYCPVVFSNNRRLKHDMVLGSGRRERHAEGCYDIE